MQQKIKKNKINEWKMVKKINKFFNREKNFTNIWDSKSNPQKTVLMMNKFSIVGNGFSLIFIWKFSFQNKQTFTEKILN